VTASAASDLAPRIAQALLAMRSDAILAADRHGVIQLWNPGAERIFGFSAEEAVGRSLDIVIPESLRARHWEGWSRAIETGRSRYGAGELLSVPAVTAEGRRISVEFTIVMLHDTDGRVDGVAAILRDVTPRFEELRSLRRELASRPASSEPKASGT
jgi:PAS domain S-box-containing protein